MRRDQTLNKKCNNNDKIEEAERDNADEMRSERKGKVTIEWTRMEDEESDGINQINKNKYEEEIKKKGKVERVEMQMAHTTVLAGSAYDLVGSVIREVERGQLSRKMTHLQ